MLGRAFSVFSIITGWLTYLSVQAYTFQNMNDSQVYFCGIIVKPPNLPEYWRTYPQSQKSVFNLKSFGPELNNAVLSVNI